MGEVVRSYLEDSAQQAREAETGGPMKRTGPASIEDIESCRSLFLLDLRESENNSLLLVVGESSLAPPEVDDPPPVPGARRVAHPRDGRVFEIVWESYVAYSVVNESFATYSDEPEREGRLLVRFTGSRFLDYISARTWDDERAPRRHWQINCENHAIDIVSTEEPIISLRISAAGH